MGERYVKLISQWVPLYVPKKDHHVLVSREENRRTAMHSVTTLLSV